MEHVDWEHRKDKQPCWWPVLGKDWNQRSQQDRLAQSRSYPVPVEPFCMEHSDGITLA
jgi:hypothetical protein